MEEIVKMATSKSDALALVQQADRAKAATQQPTPEQLEKAQAAVAAEQELKRQKPEPKAKAKPAKAKPDAKPKAKPEAKPKAKPEAKPKAKPRNSISDDAILVLGKTEARGSKVKERVALVKNGTTTVKAWRQGVAKRGLAPAADPECWALLRHLIGKGILAIKQ